MNAKFSQLLNLSRSYHQHSQYHHQHQQLNRFSLNTWRFLLDKLKSEFPGSSKRLEYFRTIQNGLKMVASFVGKECSPIVAQRAFRGYRILQLHSRLWSYNSSHPVSKRALFSFLILSLCETNNSLKKTIEDAELTTHVKDLDYIRELPAATVVCPRCKDRLSIDKQIAGVKYCTCPDSPSTVFSRKIEGNSWIPFAETADLLIWRKPHPENPGLYIYKVYGYYNDISAQDFLDVQMDIDYRKEWDDTALELQVVERDPANRSEVIYWEMKWPRMFVNRDYLFLRRHKVYMNKNDMVIMSKAVTHPAVPNKIGTQKVTEYWSVMHIRAAKGLSQTGVEFGLTYFDNPGLSLPQWLTNWAAITGIPEFLNKQRQAARIRREELASSKTSIAVSSWQSHSDKRGKVMSSPSSPSSVNPSHPGSENRTSSNPTSVTSNNKDKDSIPNSTNNDNHTTISISNDNSDNSTNPASGYPTTQQQEGKKEVLSQFFK